MSKGLGREERGYGSVKSILALLLVALGVGACSAKKPSITITVEPPPQGDNSCIGVVGWEVTVSSASGSSTTVTTNEGPVLATGQCRIEIPVSSAPIDLDESVSVIVRGFESSRTLLVQGSQTIGSIRAPNQTMVRLNAAPPAQQILVLHEDEFLGQISLADVSSMMISPFPPRGQPSLRDIAMVTPAIRPFFLVGAPGAFAMSGLTDGEVITVDYVAGSQTAMSGHVMVTNQGSYFEVQSTRPHP